MFKRIYVEITNVCNLECSFCPGTRRAGHFMTETEFSAISERLCGHTGYIYFHLMGEPLLHPLLPRLIETAHEKGFKSVITTNGTLLRERGGAVLAAPGLHRVNISLQAFEANKSHGTLEDYISSCAEFASRCALSGVICSLRLWNGGGAETLNGEIIKMLEAFFPPPWTAGQRNVTLCKNVFLERGERFDWPDSSAADMGERVFCHGLRDHIGVLCDGTVVPCCLDSDGEIPLGNLLSDTLDEILSSPRAKKIYDGFSARRASEALCRRCGYARRF